MTVPKFLKKKKTYVILAIILLVGFWISSSMNGSKGNGFETQAVEKITLSRTVEVTGEIKPAQRIDLAFERTGTIAAVHKKVGDEMKAGDVIAELQDEDLTFAVRRAQAALNAAQANLNVRLAGETSQSIRVSEADVEKAQANYDKSVIDLANAKITTTNGVKNAELALATAKSNLENGGATNEQTITNAYESLRLSLLSSVGILQAAMADGDKIIGVDNTSANDDYESVLGIADSISKARAESTYKTARPAVKQAETSVNALTSSSLASAIDNAAQNVQSALALVQSYLTDVQKVLAATIVNSSLTETQLATKKTTIDTQRSTVSTQKTSVETAAQAAKNAKLGKTTESDQLENAYKTAELNLEIAKADADTQLKTAESNLAISQASLSAAKAALELKEAGPREVDLAPLRAAVEDASVAFDQAQANLQDIRLVAPVDGVLSEVIPSVGEQATASQPAARMIGFEDFDIEILLPEADVVKVKPGQPATITLDAYGDDLVFSGTVASEEPDQTVVQDAVYYKARVQIEKTGDMEFKPGMTANVTVLTASVENAIVIPARAVRTDSKTGTQTVRVLVNDKPEERTVVTGLRGDEGRIEVKEGLHEGETVIVSEKK